MRAKTKIAVLVTTALAVTPLITLAQGMGAGGANGSAQDRAQIERGQRDLDRDRLQDRDRITTPSHDRDRIQDRTHVPDFAKLSDHDIYGSEMMTAQERNTYRNQLQAAGSSEKRARIEKEHRQQMQARAEKNGVEIVPPGKGIYGGEMMSVEERNQYREQLRLVDADEKERTKFKAMHQEKMQARAKAQGVDLEDISEPEEAE